MKVQVWTGISTGMNGEIMARLSMARLKTDPKSSSVMTTGHQIFLTLKKTNPTCPHHKKRAILHEPPDEIGSMRWFCIDCVAHAIYDRR